MKRAVQKLHSRRGASILLALLMLLVAVMVSAVILSAVVTTAKRVHDDIGQEQDYLTVSSAGRLIKAFLLQNRYFTYHTLSYEHSEPNPARRVHKNENKDSDVVKKLLEMAETMNSEDAKTGTITLSVPEDDGSVPVEPVTMDFTLKPDTDAPFTEYEKTFTLSGEIYMGANKADSPQRLFLSAKLTFAFSEDHDLAPDEKRTYTVWETVTDEETGAEKQVPHEETDPGTRHISAWTLDQFIPLTTRNDLLADAEEAP